MDEMDFLTETDLLQIKSLGISPEKVLAEIEMFKRGAPFLKLDRPCTVGDGIKRIGDDEVRSLVEFFAENAADRELLKFVPASGAASRMFKVLLQFNSENGNSRITVSEIAARADSGDAAARQLLKFMQGIRKFAFFADLREVMAADGLDLELLIEKGEFKEILDYLLTAKGLNYAERPKGLLKFHRYQEGSRTAFAEHLVEAANYAKGSGGKSRLHFTVSPEHQAGFAELVQEIKEQYEKAYEINYQIDFSVQEKATDTIAVDLKNRPFRKADGSLLFRPGGHGALLENLNRLAADVIFIKNIDNVVPDRLKGETFTWKRVICGQLLKVQRQIFAYLEQLHNGPAESGLLDEIFTFIKQELSISAPAEIDLLPLRERCDFLIKVLDRPIRVCGMVKNEGEPGGGPFWVEGRDGSLSLQIVEGAQIDSDSPGQLAILRAATHFNPVDLVCGVRNWRGETFDLKQFVDKEAVFISKKSKEGQELKALELPGIWNGAMARWNTIFVEVPLATFNPVKTINDLLRDEHQSPS
jgi:hypothetical protein